MGAIDPNTTTLILCSDHGFQSGRNSPVLNGGHRDPGVLGLWGGATQPGQIEEASILDIGPTIHRLLGLPLAWDMPGHALEQSLELPRALAPIASFTRPPLREPLPEGAGGELHRQQLEALGYVDPDGVPR
jgi:arylsulfatase A-like enzyme